jgi:competence CoiA-like predicted nuclease
VPLVALNQDGDHIVSLEYDKRLHWGFTCPYCSERVIFVDAVRKVKYFRHLVNSQCKRWSGETMEHIDMKALLYSELKKLMYHVELEPKIGGHWADLYVSNFERGSPPHGVIECQCSHMSIDEFENRTRTYNDMCMSVLWIFGRKDYRKTSKLSAVEERCWNLYGRIYYYDKGKGVYPAFIRKFRSGRTYKVYGVIPDYRLSFNFVNGPYSLLRFFDKRVDVTGG